MSAKTTKNLCIEMISEIQQMKRNLKDSEDRLSYLQDRFRGELDPDPMNFAFDDVVEAIDKIYGEKYENKKPEKRGLRDAKRSKSLQTRSKRKSKTGKSNK